MPPRTGCPFELITTPDTVARRADRTVISATAVTPVLTRTSFAEVVLSALG